MRGLLPAPVTVLTRALLVATMERPGSMMSVRPDCFTMSRTVLIRSVGVGRMSPLQAQHSTAQQGSAHELSKQGTEDVIARVTNEVITVYCS